MDTLIWNWFGINIFCKEISVNNCFTANISLAIVFHLIEFYYMDKFKQCINEKLRYSTVKTGYFYTPSARKIVKKTRLSNSRFQLK